jgi:DNA-binding ferritin-like protein
MLRALAATWSRQTATETFMADGKDNSKAALIDDWTDEAEERVWMLTSFLTGNRAHA